MSNDVKCGRCAGFGRVFYEEDGRRVNDVCYHCGGTGVIDVDMHHHDQVMSIAEMLATNHVMGLKKSRDEDPEGEGWAFCAAENMLSEHDYTYGMVSDFTYSFAEKLATLPMELQETLVEVLMEKN